MPESYRLRRCGLRIVPAHFLFDFVVDVLRQGFRGRTFQDHERDWPIDRYQQCGPTSVAKPPDADPTQINVRIAANYDVDCRDVFGGMHIGEGEKVLMFLASGNRDPRRWENADRFDVRRRTGGISASDTGSIAASERCSQRWRARFCSLLWPGAFVASSSTANR